MSKRVIFLIIIIMFLFLAVTFANADSSSLFRYGETVQPIENNNIRMIEEKVDIQVYGGWSVVRCEFVFRNESNERQRVLMGFPGSMIGVEADYGIDETTRLKDFKTYDEGVEKQVKLEKADEKGASEDRIAEWYTWDVTFEAGEERIIVNTYKTQNYNAPWGRHTGYILKTGAPWKGTIGKAVITFELMDNVPSNIYKENTKPEGYRIEKNKVIWELKDFEPIEDINLTLEGYLSIYSMIYGQTDEYINNFSKQIEHAKMLYMDGKEEEALNQINGLLAQGVYAEDLYFCLLNYYHKNGDVEGFIKALKNQIQHLNNPYILKWAEILYPERIKAEDLTYPEDHKPVIKDQAVRKLNENEFEVMADIYDEAGDMTFFASTAYTEPLTMHNILPENRPNIIYGQKYYAYREKGKLPELYTDLIWRIEVSDYKGNSGTGITIDANRPGESCYFYDGDSFKQWNVIADNHFTLSYYEDGFGTMLEDFINDLNTVLNAFVSNLGVKIPPGGYTINFYNKLHIDGLKKNSPQNITMYLKSSEYRAKLHNDSIAGKSEKESMEEWDWGEIIVDIDLNNTDNMIHNICRKVLADRFGYKWKDTDSDMLSSFISAVTGDPGKGSYYKTFSGMTTDELIKAAEEIGSTGKIGKYGLLKESNSVFIGIIIVLTIGFGVLIYNNIIHRQ
mgnify:CR=1 FL=1